MALKKNLKIDQGSDFLFDVDVNYANGSPVDLTGYSHAATIRKNPYSATSYNFVTSVPQPTEGLLRLELFANTSSQMEAGKYHYDAEVTSSAGVITRVIEGMIILTPEITR